MVRPAPTFFKNTMDLGSNEFFHWLCVLEGICALGMIGLFVHCLIMASETGELLWGMPLAILAAIAGTPLLAWATMDFWIWMF